MKMNKLFFASLLSVFFLMSCSEDDPIDPILEDDPTLLYDSGFFVLNEGQFGGDGGTVSYVSNDLGTVEQKIYAAANPAKDLGLGSVLQSMFFHGENAYIISNGSNLITVVNRFTFEFVGEINSDLNAPRYGAVADGKAYVTNQASWQTSADDFIAVINLETLEVEKTIMANAPVEYILEENGKVYVQNASFGTGNQVSIIDPMTNTIATTISVGDSLNSIEIEGNTLYALVDSAIKTVDLTTLEVTTQIDFPATMTSFSNLEVEDQKMYYTSGNKVYAVGINATEPASAPVMEATSVGFLYGFAVEDNQIFMADAGDFASDSNVYIYDATGTLVKEIPAGVAPNGFYFND